MSGNSKTAEQLNTTLEKIVNELHNADLHRWFISYGTLLGIVRSGSCIEGDDDVDLCCHASDFYVVRDCMEKAFPGTKWSKHYAKDIFCRMEPYCLGPIDIYFCSVKDGNWFDAWENCTWTDCDPLEEKQWRGTKLFLPKDPIKKLQGRYGATWQIPQKKKGVRSPKL